MPQVNPFTIRMQVARMFEQGQSFFAELKVQDWLKERDHNPQDYLIRFHQKIAPVGTNSVMILEIELIRKDGQPIDEWLLQEINRQS
jgi:lipopolysaccharide export LptBFGC system permease protein LptF